MIENIRALSLAERLRNQVHQTDSSAERKVEAEWLRWQRAPWFAGDPESWVSSRGFDLEDFKAAVAAGVGDNSHSPEPVTTASSNTASSNTATSSVALTPDRPITFDVLVEPLSHHAATEFATTVENGLAGSALAPDPNEREKLVRQLINQLRRRLVSFIQRTVVLEINVARVRSQSRGETAEQRLAEFLGKLRHPEHAAAFWAEYPVLRRLCHDEVRRWHDSLHTMLSRLRRAAEEINQMGLADRGQLISIIGPLGDAHRGGQAVWAARFADHTTVAYKPRPMAAEACFGAFTSWLTGQPGSPGLRQAAVVDFGDWGIQEWITARPCPPDELPMFYRRFGWLLAASYAVKSTDLHYENVIAAGAHPIPVDMETLAHPYPDQPMVSVLTTGLLPNQSWAQLGADTSALTGGLAQTSTSTEVPGYAGIGTDEIRLIRQPGQLAAGHNRPIEDPALRPSDFLDDILAGFHDGYRACQNDGVRLLENHGPLNGLADVDVRYLPRSTQVYASALLESLHPNLLSDAAERELYLSHLWAATRERPSLMRLTGSEMRDLVSMDIPVFTAAAGTRDLVDGHGQRLTDYFPTTVEADVRRHLAGMSDADLARQSHTITTAVRATATEPAAARPTVDLATPENDAHQDAKNPTDHAELIASQLATWAHHSDRGPQWIGLTSLATAENTTEHKNAEQESTERWCAGPVGDTLYDGRAGIALFLTSAALARPLPAVMSLANQTWQALADSTPRSASLPMGAYDGRAGIGYALAWAGLTLDEPRWIRAAANLASDLDEHLDTDSAFDVLSGAAGIALIAATLAHLPALSMFEKVAIHAADHLIRHAQPESTGWYWPAAGSTHGGLTGFAHGAAGISAALRRVADLTGQKRFGHAADAAIAWEDAQRDPHSLDWPDYRSTVTAPDNTTDRSTGPMVGWCSGAAGIGMARALSRQPDAAAIQHARREILTHANVAANERVRSHGLCHGLLGNVAILAELDRADPDGAVGHGHVQHGHRDWSTPSLGSADNWLTGHPANLPTPGLMTGLAGIGHGLLRADVPHLTPKVLSLELDHYW